PATRARRVGGPDRTWTGGGRALGPLYLGRWPCPALLYFVPPVTFTFTCALVQQHWKPPPPSPDRSLACTRTMYSPGAENVAVVENLPSASGRGRGSSNVIEPGPRCLLRNSVRPGS